MRAQGLGAWYDGFDALLTKGADAYIANQQAKTEAEKLAADRQYALQQSAGQQLISTTPGGGMGLLLGLGLLAAVFMFAKGRR